MLIPAAAISTRSATVTNRWAGVATVADGLLAVCIQHETDHLDGKLFVDYLSNLKRQRIRRKLEKAQKLAS